jgi:hypothetical protein
MLRHLAATPTLPEHDRIQPGVMTTLQHREPYSQAELDQLYPKILQLELVQVLLRHGERSPVSARFQNVRPLTTQRARRADSTMTGWSRALLAVLQCCSAHALGGYDPNRRVTLELVTMAEEVGKVWGG